MKNKDNTMCLLIQYIFIMCLRYYYYYLFIFVSFLSLSLGSLWLWDLRLFIGLSNLRVSLSSSWMSLSLFFLYGAFSWRSLWANVSSDEQCNTSNSEVCDGINEFSMEIQWIHPRVVDHSDGSNGESIQSDTCNRHAEKN